MAHSFQGKQSGSNAHLKEQTKSQFAEDHWMVLELPGPVQRTKSRSSGIQSGKVVYRLSRYPRRSFGTVRINLLVIATSLGGLQATRD